MPEIVGIVIALAFLGLPVGIVFGAWTSSVLLAPTFGLSALLLLSFSLSLNLSIAESTSTLVSIAALSAMWAPVLLIRSLRARLAMALSRADFKLFLLVILLSAAFLLQALWVGVDQYFGSVNFDFFFNSQDGRYLANHSVNDFALGFISSRSIVPLNWSADPQGRFAIGLIGAFAHRYLGSEPLLFNTYLISALLAVFGLVVAQFGRTIAASPNLIALPAAMAACAMFSAGMAQGYIYFLLGQISALPSLGAGIIVVIETLRSLQSGVGVRRNIVLLALVANVLLFSYAILAVFLGAIFAISLLSLVIVQRGRQWWQRGIRVALLLAGITLAMFLFFRIGALANVRDFVQGWIDLSLRTAGENVSRPRVFQEYLAEPAAALLLGVLNYPSTVSPLRWMLATASDGLLLSVVALAAMAGTILLVWRKRLMDASAMASFLAVALLSIVSSSVFFATGSGYSIFKVATWLVPFLIAFFAYASWQLLQGSWSMRIMAIFPALLVTANFASAATYLYSDMVGSGRSPFNNAPGLPTRTDVELMESQLPQSADRILALTDGFRTAWYAAYARSSSLQVVAHNYQVLEDKDFPAPVCERVSVSSGGPAFFIKDNAPDVMLADVEGQSVVRTDKFQAFRSDDIEQLLTVGRGTYPPEVLTTEQSEGMRAGPVIRWSEKGFEIYFYTRRGGTFDLTMNVTPGARSEKTDRQLILTYHGGEERRPFSEHATSVEFQGLSLKPGLLCLSVRSDDVFTPPQRTEAFFRQNIQFDSRVLGFAVSSLSMRRVGN